MKTFSKFFQKHFLKQFQTHSIFIFQKYFIFSHFPNLHILSYNNPRTLTLSYWFSIIRWCTPLPHYYSQHESLLFKHKSATQGNNRQSQSQIRSLYRLYQGLNMLWDFTLQPTQQSSSGSHTTKSVFSIKLNLILIGKEPSV